MNAFVSPRGLYLITPDTFDTKRLCDDVRAVLPYATWMQYRNKSADTHLRLEQGQALLNLCRQANVALIVNDDPILAHALGADGVHLGKADGSIQSARAMLGEHAIIGASCYGDLSRAAVAAASGANYLAFGAFFPSPTKPHAQVISFAILDRARRFGLPLVAIGGLTPDNAHRVIDAGADMIAVVSGIFSAVDPLVAARAYHDCFA